MGGGGGVKGRHPESYTYRVTSRTVRPPVYPRSERARQPLRNRGWVPQHHGAWAMITVPILSGVAVGGPHWRHIPLLLMWWLGYFWFYAASQWVKTRRRDRYQAAVRTYAAATAIAGVAVFLAAPWLIGWVVWFAPLLAFSGWCLVRRRERAFSHDVVIIVAACLTTLVAFDAAAPPPSLAAAVALDPAGMLRPDDGPWALSAPALAWAWRVTAVLAGYFLGTIAHVKSLIRERHNPRWWGGSLLWHTLALGLSVTATTAGWWPCVSGWALVSLAGLTLARSVALPGAARRGVRVRPALIGGVEVALSLGFFALVLATSVTCM